MRLPLLLAALVALPSAAAQQPAESPLALDVRPFPGPAQPLDEKGVQAAYELTMSCLGSGPGRPGRATVWVEKAPAWATVVVSPAAHEAPSGCATSVRVEGIIRASVGSDAPARRPASVTIAASQVDATGNRTVRATLSLEAGAFSILDVELAEPIKQARPGETVVFPVEVTNFGNAAARVVFRQVRVPDDLPVEPIPDALLESRQQGGQRIAQEVPITVTAPRGTGYSNRPDSFTVRIEAFDATSGAPGDSTEVALLLTTRGWGTPGAPAWAPILVGLALAGLRKLRS